MNSDLHQFATKYLSVVFATLMAVSFVAFVSIPYHLGGNLGDIGAPDNLAQSELRTPTPTNTPAPAPEA